ncbi:immunoglobulin lambda-1 light chain-like [Perca flavescens]|uniref:immunoglobulin lambda-1 light chain-like n=1 Tax=Perca flavescens TaxID=8167 RepID=UPI00106E0319|nr:immunoglobulin lambda-1 light chain-like [Perca flavescens]
MLFLPAAALCCLCSALAAMATQLIQDDLTLTRRVGGDVSFNCRGTEQCDDDEVFWYQKRDTETFTRILYIMRNTGVIEKERYNHPQKDDFSAVNIQNGCKLQIQKVKLDHSATYYCSCWNVGVGLIYIFGSGTKLIVTDEPVVKPVVSVYPAASRAHLEGKSSLLCLASAMFPPLVQFSWKRRKENGPLEELPRDEGQQLEIRKSGCIASILLIHQKENSKYKYSCYVRHEGGTVEAETEQEVSTLPTSPPSLPPATSVPSQHLSTVEAQTVEAQTVEAQTEPEVSTLPPSASVPSQYQVKLFCLLYTQLIVKSLVYCCGLSLLMILRNKGPSTS